MAFNTAITATIGADVAPLAAAGPQVASATDKLAGAMEHRLLGAREVSTAVATSLGLNFEKIAEKVARFATGVSEEEEKNLKMLDTLSSQVADANIEAMHKRLTVEQQLQLALQERVRIEKAIAVNIYSSTAAQVKRLQDELALNKANAVVKELQAKIDADMQAKADEAMKNTQRLKGEVDEINKKNAAELAKERQVDFDLQQKADEAHLQYVSENREMLLLEAKSVQGLTVDEAARLDVLKLIVKQRNEEEQITTLLALNKRTPQEEALLQSLIQQSA